MNKVWLAGAILVGIASATAGAIAAKKNIEPVADQWRQTSPNPVLITGTPLCDPEKGFFEGIMAKGEYAREVVAISDTNVVINWWVNRHTKEWAMITFTPADRMYCLGATGKGWFAAPW